MKKLKASLNVFTKISLLCFAFFVLSPSLQVQAVFSDTANINMGIKLELGTISLASKDSTIIDSVKFTEGDSVTLASSKLVNDGSLTGKLAYKIDVTKENGLGMTPDELKNTVITIEFGSVANKVEATASSLNTDSFTFAKDISGSEVIVEPDSVGEVPVTITYKSNNAPIAEEKLTIKITLKLIQSNAADPNVETFSDEESLTNTVTLVPEVVEVESYWPSESTFAKTGDGKTSYSLEKMNMVFSEVYDSENSNTKQIKNLNKAVLYIQFLENESFTTTIIKDGKEEKINTFDISNINTGNTAIVVDKIEMIEAHNGIKITFKLMDSYTYGATNPENSLPYANKDKYPLQLGFNIQKYKTMYNHNNYDYYTHIELPNMPYFATRLVLSSDLVVPINNSDTKYTQLPIKLTTDDVILSFKKFNTMNPSSADPIHFKDVQLSNEIVEFEVIEKTSRQVSYSLISNNVFSLELNSNGTFDGAALNVKITGDIGNTLVISRKLINSPQTQTTSIKSIKVPLINKETEEQTKQQSDTAKTIEEPNSTNDSTVPNERTIEVPIEDAPQEDADDGDEETIDSSSIDSNSEIKEEAVPIENSDQTTPEEESDEKINE